MSTELDTTDENPDPDGSGLPELRNPGWRVYFEEAEIGERTTVTDTTSLTEALETAASTIASYGAAGIEYTTEDGETWVAYLPRTASPELLYHDYETGPVWENPGRSVHPVVATAYHVERLRTEYLTGFPYGTDLSHLDTGYGSATVGAE